MPRIDLDAYVVAHAHEWARLEQLVRGGRLSGPQGDELVDRYQQVATHLSVIRTAAPDADVVAYLSSLLGRARIRMLGARVLSWRAAAGFFTHQFPAALYRLRWWWLGTMAGSVICTGVMMWWLVEHPQVEQSLLSPEEVDALVNHDFEHYYSASPAQDFASHRKDPPVEVTNVSTRTHRAQNSGGTECRRTCHGTSRSRTACRTPSSVGR